MNNAKKLFYEAKSVNATVTAKKIAELLNNKGIKQEKVYTKDMVSNMIAGKTNDENILIVLKELAKPSKSTLQNA
jgi:hypothetical protein